MSVSSEFVIFIICVFLLMQHKVFGLKISNYCNMDSDVCVIRNTNISGKEPFVFDDNSTYSTKVKELIFENSHLQMVPAVFHQLPNLTQLSMVSCGISSINKNDLESAKSLEMLDLTLNGIKELPSDIIFYATSVVDVRFGHNYIVTLDAYAFRGASKLEELQLNSNKIKTIPPGFFEPLLALKYIDLEYNQIEFVDKNTFLNNINLRTILLNNNNIMSFESISFQHIPSINILDLSYNTIEEIQLNSVNTMRANHAGLKTCYINGSVVNLYINNNHLRQVFINNLSVTRQLDLKNNHITSLGEIVNAHNLQSLDFSYNPVGIITSSTFGHFKDLETLILRGTNLTTIHYGSLSYLTSLVTLDISDNNLNELDLAIFHPLQNLKRIYLDGNNLTSLNYLRIKMYNTKLEEIGITNNSWNCSYLQVMMKYFRYNGINLNIAGPTTATSVAGIACNKSNTNTDKTSPDTIEYASQLDAVKKELAETSKKMSELLTTLGGNSNAFINTIIVFTFIGICLVLLSKITRHIPMCNMGMIPRCFDMRISSTRLQEPQEL